MNIQDERTASALKLWVVLSRAFRAMATVAQRDVDAHGLHLSEFAVLEALYHKGPLSLSDLRDRVLLTSGSTTHLVDKLVSRGLIERRSCPEDRRVCYAALTPEGTEVIRSIFPAHADAITRAMDGLTPEERRITTALLKRLGKGIA